MALKSGTYNVRAPKVGSAASSHEAALKGKHQSEIKRVVDEAKKFADDRKQALENISDAALRRSAAR